MGLLEGDTGKAEMLPHHFVCTNSAMFDDWVLCRSSSTSSDGPEITRESDDLLIERRSTPPRISLHEVLDDCAASAKNRDVSGGSRGISEPRVRSRPFVCPLDNRLQQNDWQYQVVMKR